MTKRHVGRWIATVGLTALLGLAPELARAATEAPATARHESTGAAPKATAPSTPEEANDQELRYAAREARSPQLASYEGGGSAIYISGSALAVVLVVVLIVVLL